MKRSLYVIIALILFIALAAAQYHWGPGAAPYHEYQALSQPQYTLKQYLTAVYSRDYNTAYQWVSTEDRRVKSQTVFLRENPSFSGSVLHLVQGLADKMELSDVRSEVHGSRAKLSFKVSLPDANAPSLQKLFLEFDPDRLNALSEKERQGIDQQVNSMANQGSLPMIQGEESWELVKESEGWRIFLNWAGATRILFEAKVKEDLPWRFEPLQESILAKPGETLQAIYRVRNLSNQTITAKARHLDEPRELAAKYLEIVQCFCFIQQTLAPGEEKELPIIFRVHWDVPPDVREFRVTYEFYPINKFPEK